MANTIHILLTAILAITLYSYPGYTAPDSPEDESAASDDMGDEGDDEGEDEEGDDAPLNIVQEGEKIPPVAPSPVETTEMQPEPALVPPPVSAGTSALSAPSAPFKTPKIVSSPKLAPKPSPKKPVGIKKYVGFKTVKTACAMREGANSASKEVGKAKTKSKIWVEEVNESWFKVYRKAGAAFVNTDCLN
ncbi:MAG: hypothetical protein SGJ18_02610 [Pseudomonadota bacterium]|nr:hypothetical protein [Pseudomonadota bacterium]